MDVESCEKNNTLNFNMKGHVKVRDVQKEKYLIFESLAAYALNILFIENLRGTF